MDYGTNLEFAEVQEEYLKSRQYVMKCGRGSETIKHTGMTKHQYNVYVHGTCMQSSYISTHMEWESVCEECMTQQIMVVDLVHLYTIFCEYLPMQPRGQAHESLLQLLPAHPQCQMEGQDECSLYETHEELPCIHMMISV